MPEKLTLRNLKPRSLLLDSLTVDQLRADREHMSVAYMAQKYGVSKSTMYRKLRKEGLVDGEKTESPES